LIFVEKPRKGLVLGNEIPKPLFYIAFIGVLRTLPWCHRREPPGAPARSCQALLPDCGEGGGEWTV